MENNFTKNFENTVKTSYSEFGKEGKELKNWGIAKYKGKPIEFYSDPTFIKEYFSDPILDHLKEKKIDPSKTLELVDFGGGDGVLISTLLKQLKDEDYNNIHGLNIDYTLKNLEKMKQSFTGEDKINMVQADITELPIKNNSVDIATSRHVIQYFGKKDQIQFLRNIFDSLKSESFFAMKWPGANNPEQSQILTDFYAKTFAICTGESSEKVAENKYFTSYQEVEKIVKDIGFKIINSGKCSAELGITAEGFFDRFNLTDEQKKDIKNIFENFYEQYKDHSDVFEMTKDENDTIYIIQHHNYMHLEKGPKFNFVEIEEKQFNYDDQGFVEFGSVAMSLLEQQAQYASRYADDLDNDYPNLGEGLNIKGGCDNYRDMKIHKDDIVEFVKKVREYKENR